MRYCTSSCAPILAATVTIAKTTANSVGLKTAAGRYRTSAAFASPSVVRTSTTPGKMVVTLPSGSATVEGIAFETTWKMTTKIAASRPISTDRRVTRPVPGGRPKGGRCDPAGGRGAGRMGERVARGSRGGFTRDCSSRGVDSLACASGERAKHPRGRW